MPLLSVVALELPTLTETPAIGLLLVSTIVPKKSL